MSAAGFFALTWRRATITTLFHAGFDLFIMHRAVMAAWLSSLTVMMTIVVAIAMSAPALTVRFTTTIAAHVGSWSRFFDLGLPYRGRFVHIGATAKCYQTAKANCGQSEIKKHLHKILRKDSPLKIGFSH